MTKELKQTFTRKITQANRTQLVVIVYEMLLVYLEDAKNAFEQNQKSVFVENIKMARECIGQMRTSLNFEYELSRNLFSIYCFADKELARDMYRYKTDHLDVIQMIFTKLHDAFYQVSENDHSAPLMNNIQSVYVGLTYSKGELNESLVGNFATRGFQA